MVDTSKYDVFIDVIKPRNILCNKSCDLSKLTFNEYNVIKSIFNNPNLEDIKDLFIHLYRIRGNINISASDVFLNDSIFNLFRAKNYIKEFMIKRDSLERKVLSSEPDYKMIAINASERLSYFNVELTKIRLAEQFSLDPSVIGDWKYTKVFNILAANNALNKVNADYAKVK